MANDPTTEQSERRSFSFEGQLADIDRSALESLIERARSEQEVQGRFEFGATFTADEGSYGILSAEVAKQMALSLGASVFRGRSTATRCGHKLDPVSHNCTLCGKTAEALEELARSCIWDNTGHKMHLDYMDSGEEFCDKCRLLQSQIDLLTRPVVAGDEAAARGELLFLPDIDTAGQEN